jgi:hypothetical protein
MHVVMRTDLEVLMTTFIALYRGQTIAEARIIAVSADPSLVADVSSRLLQSQTDENQDTIIAAFEMGRRDALRLIKQEAADERK